MRNKLPTKYWQLTVKPLIHSTSVRNERFLLHPRGSFSMRFEAPRDLWWLPYAAMLISSLFSPTIGPWFSTRWLIVEGSTELDIYFPQEAHKVHALRVKKTLGSELLPSGKRLHSYGKSPFSMGKSTISMPIFNSYVTNYQRVNSTSFCKATIGPLLWSCRSSTTASTYVANASLARKAFGVPWTKKWPWKQLVTTCYYPYFWRDWSWFISEASDMIARSDMIGEPLLERWNMVKRL